MRLVIHLEKTAKRFEATLNLKGIYHYEGSGPTENEALHNLVDKIFPKIGEKEEK